MARKQRVRTRHPGVKILQRSLKGGIVWIARWTDPDSGRSSQCSLKDEPGCSDAAGRRRWAIDKYESLRRREAELISGAPKRSETALAAAIQGYLENSSAQLRPRTIETYRAGIDRFLAWAQRRGLSLAEDLTGPQLAAFREQLIAGSMKKPVNGGRRGEKAPTSKRRSPATTNSLLRSVKAAVNYLRRLGLTPKLDRDAISDALFALRTPRPELEYLKSEQLRELLEATLRHDSETFKITRAEHRGAGKPGSTPRYAAITPLTVFLLLTGCRVGEALGLRWSDIDLAALDDQGAVVGEISLEAAATKTGHARRIDLAVSPALRRLLLAMKAQSRDKVVFGWPRSKIDSARKRLIREFAAPPFTWQALRQTAGTFLTCAPGIFGAASAYRSAKQLGHSVSIAERHYVGVIRGIPRTARTLDAAMGLEELLERAIAAVSAQPED